MDGDNNTTESESSTKDRQSRTRDRLEQLIRERDAITPSPEAIASYVLDLLNATNPNLTNWDLLCFCTEYLGSQVLIYPWLGENEVRNITQIVQQAHYTRDDIPETGVI